MEDGGTHLEIARGRRRVKKKSPLSCILPGLFLSGAPPAKNLNILTSFNISAIVNVGGGECTFPTVIQYHKIGILDHADATMLPYFDAACDFIHNNISIGNSVLVHCMGGFSRSPTIVIAYLVKYHKLSVQEALELVRYNHPRAIPRPNFMNDLHRFETQI